MVLCVGALPKMKSRHAAMKEWEAAKILYDNKDYGAAAGRYEELRERMNWNATYMYEYGLSLSKTRRHAEAIDILSQTLQISSDAMVLNTLGKSYQALGQYAEAERHYKRSVRRMPNRLYPHYLLFMLYAEREWDKPEKRRAEAETIVKMPVKVESPATKEIQATAQEYLK